MSALTRDPSSIIDFEKAGGLVTALIMKRTALRGPKPLLRGALPAPGLRPRGDQADGGRRLGDILIGPTTTADSAEHAADGQCDEHQRTQRHGRRHCTADWRER